MSPVLNVSRPCSQPAAAVTLDSRNNRDSQTHPHGELTHSPNPRIASREPSCPSSEKGLLTTRQNQK